MQITNFDEWNVTIEEVLEGSFFGFCVKPIHSRSDAAKGEPRMINRCGSAKVAFKDQNTVAQPARKRPSGEVPPRPEPITGASNCRDTRRAFICGKVSSLFIF